MWQKWACGAGRGGRVARAMRDARAADRDGAGRGGDEGSWEVIGSTAQRGERREGGPRGASYAAPLVSALALSFYY